MGTGETEGVNRGTMINKKRGEFQVPNRCFLPDVWVSCESLLKSPKAKLRKVKEVKSDTSLSVMVSNGTFIKGEGRKW